MQCSQDFLLVFDQNKVSKVLMHKMRKLVERVRRLAVLCWSMAVDTQRSPCKYHLEAIEK